MPTTHWSPAYLSPPMAPTFAGLISSAGGFTGLRILNALTPGVGQLVLCSFTQLFDSIVFVRAPSGNVSFFYALDSTTQSLFSVALNNTLGTRLGQVGASVPFSLPADFYLRESISLAYLNGVLYVTAFNLMTKKYHLFSVNPTTGQAALVGDINTGGTLACVGGITAALFLAENTIFMAEHVTELGAVPALYKVNLDTGEFVSVGSITRDTGDSPYNISHIVFDGNGTFWLVYNTVPGTNLPATLGSWNGSDPIDTSLESIQSNIGGLTYGVAPWTPGT